MERKAWRANWPFEGDAHRELVAASCRSMWPLADIDPTLCWLVSCFHGLNLAGGLPKVRYGFVGVSSAQAR